jgi:hypothetical protein
MEYFSSLIEKERRNVSTNINVQELLNAAQNVDMDYLGGKTLKQVSEEIVQSLSPLNLKQEQVEIFCQKLVYYRFVDQIYQLHKGKHIRWIRISNISTPPVWTLTNGGIVVDIKFTDNGVQVLCKNKLRFIKFKFDDCLIYQKLSDDEQLILSCINHINV